MSLASILQVQSGRQREYLCNRGLANALELGEVFACGNFGWKGLDDSGSLCSGAHPKRVVPCFSAVISAASHRWFA